MSENQQIDEASAAPARNPSQAPLCFVVDEEPSIRHFLSLILHGAGVDTQEFPDGRSLRQALAGPHPDLICFNVSLEANDAIESIAALGKHAYKGPVQPGPMKMREEQETEVADAEVLRRVLQELGLEAWFRYQKFREEFEAPGVVIALDETPVGTYIEIEGSEEGILTVTDALGCSPADFILDSYRGLFAAFAQAHNLTVRDMLFDASDGAGA